MTDKELRKLNRAELLEMLLEQSREEDRLREQLRRAEEQLNCRRLELKEAGSIAEASLRIHQVFEAAQQAADQYLDNVRRQASSGVRLEEESRRKAAQLLADTEAKCRAMEAETQDKCTRMLREAEEQADRTWEELRGKLQQFVDQQPFLRELLDMTAEESARP